MKTQMRTFLKDYVLGDAIFPEFSVAQRRTMFFLAMLTGMALEAIRHSLGL